ncbi:MAG: hypothetical protein AB1758_29595 [Candidatus Eremiobacterota bacterium]
MPGPILRWGLVLVGALLLAGDVAQDLTMWSHPEQRSLAWGVSLTVRNLLLLAALVGVALNRSWGLLLLAVSGGLGLIRRGLFLMGPMAALQPPVAADPLFSLTHGGADLAFRILILALVADYFLSRRSQP